MMVQARTLGNELRSVYKAITDEQQRRPLTPEQQEIHNRVQPHFGMLLLILPLGDMLSPWNAITLQSLIYHRHSVRALSNSISGWPSDTPLNPSAEGVRTSFEQSEHPDYFQIHSNFTFTRPIRSKGDNADLTLDMHGLLETNDKRYDDLDVAQLGQVRRIVYRTYLNTTNFSMFGGRPAPPANGGGRPGGGFPRPGDTQIVYVQYARKLSDLTDQKAGITANRDEQLLRIETETRESQGTLRVRVAGIACLTFVALIIGGWFIIGFGLSPLRKLTNAVSRVNERDFRLNMDKSDLTVELLPIHDKLNQSLDALRIAFEREKEAIADISHELRTPVAGLLATLDVALRRPRTAEQYQTTLEECRAISKQLAQLVERVMTLAYLDADQTKLNRFETDAAALAEGCAAVIRPLSESQSLTFRTDIDGPTTLDTDPDKLREVMINLLHNAVEYNRPGGQIELRVHSAKDGGAVVEVADTGIGMTTEVQAKIFERFYRADPSRTQTGIHAGLGLAIVKEYVNRLGGTIAVESEIGRGSTFRVTLPG
jgi:two-component system, OmpR family, heavy metal sensor histidine kinase CusS